MQSLKTWHVMFHRHRLNVQLQLQPPSGQQESRVLLRSFYIPLRHMLRTCFQSVTYEVSAVFADSNSRKQVLPPWYITIVLQSMLKRKDSYRAHQLLIPLLVLQPPKPPMPPAFDPTMKLQDGKPVTKELYQTTVAMLTQINAAIDRLPTLASSS